jgi:uncharacterized protein YkwD
MNLRRLILPAAITIGIALVGTSLYLTPARHVRAPITQPVVIEVPVKPIPDPVDAPVPFTVKVAKLKPAAFVAGINDLRARKKLKPVKLNTDLSTAALAHVRDVSKHDSMDHTGSDGSSPWDRAARSGYTPVRIGESVIAGTKYLSDADVYTVLSSKHKDLLLSSNFTEVGVAKVVDPKSTHKVYWVVLFAGKSK